MLVPERVSLFQGSWDIAVHLALYDDVMGSKRVVFGPLILIIGTEMIGKGKMNCL